MQCLKTKDDDSDTSSEADEKNKQLASKIIDTNMIVLRMINSKK
jgi:hypothetical protein